VAARYDLVEINTAAPERIDNVAGIGPALAARMIRERAIRPFTGCRDLVNRVAGVGPMSAAKFSERGLRVNGEVCRQTGP